MSRATSNAVNSQKSAWRQIKGARDTGQRYKVLYRDGAGAVRVFGFADDEKTVQQYRKKIEANRFFRFLRVVDRGGQRG